eukprot:3338756-Rhodomonas_salina.1
MSMVGCHGAVLRPGCSWAWGLALWGVRAPVAGEGLRVQRRPATTDMCACVQREEGREKRSGRG